MLARISEDELNKLFIGYGYQPYLVEGNDPKFVHQVMAATLDKALGDIQAIQIEARSGSAFTRPR